MGARGSFPSPVIDVERGYEAYLARLRDRSPRFTRTTLAKERKLGREVGEVRYVHDERDPAVLRTLIGWKSAQYRRTGRSDRFARAHPGPARSGAGRQPGHGAARGRAALLSDGGPRPVRVSHPRLRL
ncbi:hypothetical protein SSPO_076000 [Streptomyces antimycoticus]|uniref:BioF2-like acetyltransferase domain-containing protein n=1 Tax=Streptomyces antimycoticus TaxID=68175 RepID=A0A499UUQ8_9ACTN|nr:hypothetical protein SSPO_076000 [Streptomyces antimycoticus]